jgi:hypothetical protein
MILLNIFINKLKIYTIILIVLALFFIMFNKFYVPDFSLSDIVFFVKDVNLHGHISVSKDAGKAIGQGLQTIGSQVGLGATMVGVATVVGKTIAKSSLPPLQKAGVILGTSIVSGLAHSGISSINRNTIKASEENNTTSASNIDTSSYVNNLLDNSNVSPLQDLLFNLEMMNYVCLSLIYILIIQLIFKLYFKDTINLNFFNLLSNKTKIKLEYFFNKVIKLNKQTSVIWIWISFMTITFGSSFDAYLLHNLCADIDSFINVHNSFYSNYTGDNINTINKSILDVLENLKLINYVSILSIIFLMLQIVLKFHFNKNKNSIYIWLLLLILILSLAFSAYTCNDLYTNLNSYVKMYINMKNK